MIWTYSVRYKENDLPRVKFGTVETNDATSAEDMVYDLLPKAANDISIHIEVSGWDKSRRGK